jgi:hypothetical protein
MGTPKTFYTSIDILAMGYNHIFNNWVNTIDYRLSKSELIWVTKLKNKYDVVDYILDHIDNKNIVTLNIIALTNCLDDKALETAKMSIPRSALVRLFCTVLYSKKDN